MIYYIDQWLSNTYKSKVVYTWTDQYFHAEARTTSRLKGAHYILKSWIGSSTADLTRVWESTLLAINIELSQIAQKRARKLQSIPIALSNQIYFDIKSKITHYGLYKLKEQYDLFLRHHKTSIIDNISTICTGNFYRSFSLPCWHIIRAKVANNLPIQPLDFHPFCHYYRPPPGAEPVVFEPPILEPVNRQRQRAFEIERRAHARQNRRLHTAQTERILSQFEQAIQPLRHCSACVIHGHNKAICQKCRSTGHTRSNCPFIPTRNTPNTYQIQQNQEVYNLLYGSQTVVEEYIPATQYTN